MITLDRFNNKIRPFGLVAEAKNDGHQFYIKCPAGVLNFYPKRERWCNDKGQFSQGITEFLTFLEKNINRLNRKPMHWREYVCMQAFGFAFAELDQVEAYGFNSWAKLFDYVVKNNVQELQNKDGEIAYVVEEYEHLTIADILTVLYEDFVYLLQGVNDFNVNLNGV